MFSFYLHIPFCGQVCSYCDFAVLKGGSSVQKRFLSLALQEAQIRWSRDAQNRIPHTAYWGGGTPTELSAPDMEHLLQGFRQQGLLHSHLQEFTVECNPESCDESRIEVLQAGGVDRWSLGVQSFHDELLRAIGRRGTAAEAKTALQHLSLAGGRISADLMFALPQQSPEHFFQDLECLIASGVGHVSFYGLTVESNTLLGQRVHKGMLSVPEDLYTEFYLGGAAILERAGVLRYEVSNFAKPGQEGIHNRNYWRRMEYLGIGPGAHSYLNGVRYGAPRAFARWEEWVLADCPLEGMEVDQIGVSEALTEYVWLGLRQSQGISIEDLWMKYRVKTDDGQIRRWVEKGWVEVSPTSLRLRGEGWVFLDLIVAELLARLHE